MVVSALVQLAIAGPVGILFGLGYGTAIRVGYEQVYPALFGDKELPKDTDTILKKLETFYTSVGGLEAHKFGINQGIKNALKAIDADPELVALIKKNSELDSQNITVNLSGTSVQTPGSGQLAPSSPSVEIPPGLSMSILSYVKALATAAKQQKLDEYSRLIDQIGLSDSKIYWLVKNGSVSQVTAGHTIKILWNFLSLQKQEQYVIIHNRENERLRLLNKPQGPQTDAGGLLGGVQPVGVKWKKAAGQSQRIEKTKLIGEIRALKSQIAAVNRITMTKIERKRLLDDKESQLLVKRQSLANLLARYIF